MNSAASIGTQSPTHPTSLPKPERGSLSESADIPDAQLARDLDHERHIAECGREIELAMQRWEIGGNFADKGDSDFWRMAMERAIRERSPAQIARMQAESDARLAREPGASRLA